MSFSTKKVEQKDKIQLLSSVSKQKGIKNVSVHNRTHQQSMKDRGQTHAYENYNKQAQLSKKGKNIRNDCLAQNQKFKKWANIKSWSTFHSSHYDWWAFPIDQSSGSYGSAYKVQNQDEKLLIIDKTFINALQQNATLVCYSWGWDLKNGKFITNPGKEQKWQRWPIRLSKMCRSLEIFKEGNIAGNKLFANAIKYSMIILSQYKKLTYSGKDLSIYFIEKDKEINSIKKGQKIDLIEHKQRQGFEKEEKPTEQKKQEKCEKKEQQSN